jgi:hypothetical protein
MPEERKLVTILFADVTGSTALGDSLIALAQENESAKEAATAILKQIYPDETQPKRRL